MITIVIADDEKLIRAGLKKILTDSFEIPLKIFDAKNGTEALELCQKEKPEIIITDIRMPSMDGVELMKHLNKLPCRPAIIVLSGFDDFSYAKAAIQNGAVSYILKPVDKKELLNAVNEAIASSQKQEKERNEQALRSIVDEGHLDSTNELKGCHFESGLYCATISGTSCVEIIEKTLRPVQYFLLEQKKDFACYVIPREALYLLETDMSLAQFCIGVSAASDSVSALRSLRRQSFSALLQSFFSDTGEIVNKKRTGIFYYSEQDSATDFSMLDKNYERCVGKLDIVSAAEVQNSVKELFELSIQNIPNAADCLSYLYNKILTNLFTKFPGYTDTDMYLHLKGVMIESIWEMSNFFEWESCTCDYMVYLATILKQNTTEYPYIEEAIKYVNTHFTKNINMAIVANQVSVNYTWFSEKFKEHTGINFNEYLKRLRIEEAERLLEQGCYKVYEVAQRSGFGDDKYFMKTFKEETGMSPTEWKNKHRKNESVK